MVGIDSLSGINVHRFFYRCLLNQEVKILSIFKLLVTDLVPSLGRIKLGLSRTLNKNIIVGANRMYFSCGWSCTVAAEHYRA